MTAQQQSTRELYLARAASCDFKARMARDNKISQNLKAASEWSTAADQWRSRAAALANGTAE